MPEAEGAFKRYVAELKRRRVFRTAAGYLVAAWVPLQVADVTFEPLGLPHWSQRALPAVTSNRIALDRGGRMVPSVQ